MGNVIIIGTGPAGISAALYTARAKVATTLIGKGPGALEKAEQIENYYGFARPVAGKTLLADGMEQALRAGAEIVRGEVVSLGYADKLTVKTVESEYAADCVILATGASRRAPGIKGLAEYEGRGVGYCAVCDAFFHKGKDVAVLGCCEYALSEAAELLPVVNSVTLLTNGETPISNIPPKIKIITAGIEEFAGGRVLEEVVFKNGEKISVSGVFVAVGVAGSTELARNMGAEIRGNTIVVDSRMATGIPGLYAAGDCTGGMFQIAKAVYQGAVAGTEAVKYIREEKKK
ncbi:MAG: NAD(P)/FAD-dependent oxidoreductase [Oscillospiraceae bacterium]|nr:NAD(P)/FAD-dependent oxidoreductase [Oscillospiraceae bacterium]